MPMDRNANCIHVPTITYHLCGLKQSKDSGLNMSLVFIHNLLHNAVSIFLSYKLLH